MEVFRVLFRWFSWYTFPLIALSPFTRLSRHGKRIFYHIKEQDTIIDSSNMSMGDWTVIAKDIEKYYKDFDAFIVLHGTDTLAYSASALSFMLEGLGKTVILTGAQVCIVSMKKLS